MTTGKNWPMTDWISAVVAEPENEGWYPVIASYDQGEFGFTDKASGSFYKKGKWWYDEEGELNPPVIRWLNIKCGTEKEAKHIAIEKSQK